MRTLLHRPRRRLSVTAYLLVAFGTCTVVLVAVVAQGTRLSFERERSYARQSLRAITQETVSANTTTASTEVSDFASGMIKDPRLLSSDPGQCLQVFDGIKAFLTTEHVHVLRADGTEVCAVYGPDAKPQPLDTSAWIGKVLSSRTTFSPKSARR